MSDFPRSLIEFQHRFPDEGACASYLADARWPDGFRCPTCGDDKGWELATKAFTRECAGWGKQTSVTAGRIGLPPPSDFLRFAFWNKEMPCLRCYGRAGAIERLDLALFVDRQHSRVARRIDVETHDVLHLGGEGGIARQLEGA